MTRFVNIANATYLISESELKVVRFPIEIKCRLLYRNGRMILEIEKRVYLKVFSCSTIERTNSPQRPVRLVTNAFEIQIQQVYFSVDRKCCATNVSAPFNDKKIRDA